MGVIDVKKGETVHRRGDLVGTLDIILKGKDYESFVSYWIAFKGNSYGLHDASWRSRFGGNIYTYNGSHGCVNMPRSEVSKLYNMVEIGTPVYVH